MAVELFRGASVREGLHPRIVHSDGGPAMKSALLADYYRHAGVSATRNRPRVSNDNPYIESYFKAEKYRPDWPGYFTSLEHARAWSVNAVSEYNHRHHHSGLGGFTPMQVHDRAWRGACTPNDKPSWTGSTPGILPATAGNGLSRLCPPKSCNSTPHDSKQVDTFRCDPVGGGTPIAPLL